MTQPVNFFLGKHEELSLDSRSPCENLGMATAVCISEPQCWGGDGGRLPRAP